jgi:hypothetical protein
MARIALSDLTPWITEAVLAHPQDLPACVSQRLNISRTSARTQLNKLVEAQWLARDGVSRKAVYKPGALRQVVRRYPLQGCRKTCPGRRISPAASTSSRTSGASRSTCSPSC